MWLRPFHTIDLIHPSAWKGNSANFACTEFAEEDEGGVLKRNPALIPFDL